MGDDDGRVTAAPPLQGIENAPFGAGVHGGEGVVQHQNRRLLEQRPGQRQPLPLAAGKREAALADLRFVAGREVDDGVVDRRFLGYRAQLAVGRLGPRHAQIGGDAARIQERVLQHHADLLAQPLPIHFAHVHAVDQDAPGVERIEAHQEPHQRRLAGTRRADDADRLPGRNAGAEVHHRGAVRLVAGAHHVEHHLASGPRLMRRPFAALLFGFQDVVDAPQGDDGLAGIREHLAEPPHREDHHGHQTDEDEQPAHADGAVRQEHPAGDQHQADLPHRQRVADAPVQGFQRVHPVERIAVGAVADAEALHLVGLAGERPHHANAGEVLLQHGGHGAFRFVGDLELPPHLGEEQEGADGQNRHQRHGEPRQLRIAQEEDRRHRRHHQQRAPDLHHMGSEEHAHRLHVRTAALHQIARVRGIEEAGRQIVQPPIELVAQPPGDVLRGDGRPAPAQIHEERPDPHQRQGGQGREREIGDEGGVAGRVAGAGRIGSLGSGGPRVAPTESHAVAQRFNEPRRPAHKHRRPGREIALGDHVQGVAGHHRRRQHAGVGRADGRNRGDVAQALAARDDPEIAPSVVVRIHDRARNSLPTSARVSSDLAAPKTRRAQRRESAQERRQCAARIEVPDVRRLTGPRGAASMRPVRAAEGLSRERAPTWRASPCGR